MRRLITGLALSIASCHLALAADVYRWQDPSGTPHFGSQPPEGIQATRLNQRLAQAEAVPLPLPKLDSQKADDEQRKIDERVKAEVAQQESNRTMFCTTLRTDLAHLKNNPRVRVPDGGEMRRLTEEERQARIGTTEQRIRENCD